jgi:hypothetical protein
LTETLRSHGGLLGAATYMMPELDRALDGIFRIASENGFDLDFHVDETSDPGPGRSAISRRQRCGSGSRAGLSSVTAARWPSKRQMTRSARWH